MFVSARFERSKTYPEECWIELKGLGPGTGIIGISTGSAYALRDALHACLEEFETYQKEHMSVVR